MLLKKGGKNFEIFKNYMKGLLIVPNPRREFVYNFPKSFMGFNMEGISKIVQIYCIKSFETP